MEKVRDNPVTISELVQVVHEVHLYLLTLFYKMFVNSLPPYCNITIDMMLQRYLLMLVLHRSVIVPISGT